MNMTYKLIEECIKNEDYIHANDYMIYCYFSCINRINEKKIVPNENLMNTIKKFNSIDLDILTQKAIDCVKNNINNISNDNNYDKQKQINEKTEKNLIVRYNFTREGIVSANIIVDEINNDIDKYNTRFNKKSYPKIYFEMGKNVIKSDIYPQVEILDKLTMEYNKFNKDLDTTKINSEILLHCCLNIFLFLRNNPGNEKGIKTEVKDILRSIFYVYLKKYLEEEKTKKEKETETKKVTIDLAETLENQEEKELFDSIINLKEKI